MSRAGGFNVRELQARRKRLREAIERCDPHEGPYLTREQLEVARWLATVDTYKKLAAKYSGLAAKE